MFSSLNSSSSSDHQDALSAKIASLQKVIATLKDEVKQQKDTQEKSVTDGKDVTDNHKDTVVVTKDTEDAEEVTDLLAGLQFFYLSIRNWL